MRLHPWHRQATHPAVRHWHDNEWATSVQNRATDAITRFSGSMTFVYIDMTLAAAETVAFLSKF